MLLKRGNPFRLAPGGFFYWSGLPHGLGDSFQKARHPEPPSNRRRRWLVVYGGYVDFDPSPPAIMFVAGPDKMIVAPQYQAQQIFRVVAQDH
jgi:hypothetical protein